MYTFNHPAVASLVMVILLSAGSFMPFSVVAQNASPKSARTATVEPMGNWMEFKQVKFTGSTIRVHLRTGFERAVLMPEPVQKTDPAVQLPGCDVVVDLEVVGFYPRGSFNRHTIRFTGLNSGDIYELSIRSSPAPEGQVQPIQINR